jgi:hypothetical protein
VSAEFELELTASDADWKGTLKRYVEHGEVVPFEKRLDP